MAIHQTRSIRSLYDRSQLLISDQFAACFYQFLKRYPVSQVRNTQLDYPTWHSKKITPKILAEEAPVERLYSRTPLGTFSYLIYMQFFRERNLSLAQQVSYRLFSARYQNYVYRISENTFAYYTANSVKHYVLWFNPRMCFTQQTLSILLKHVTDSLSARGYKCFLYQNDMQDRSVPEVLHYQLFIYT